MAKATGKAAGSSAKEKRVVRAPAGTSVRGTRRQKEKGPGVALPSSRRARPVGVVSGEVRRPRKVCDATTAEAAREAKEWQATSQESRSKIRSPPDGESSSPG